MRPAAGWRAAIAAFWRDDGPGGSGQALVEFAVAFPLQLFLTFGIMQFALLQVSQLMVNYAAFKACRAAISSAAYVGDPDSGGTYDPLRDARSAAAVVLTPLAGTHIDSARLEGASPVTVPGWGQLKGSDLALAKTLVTDLSAGDADNLRLVVEFEQELAFPVVDALYSVFYGRDEDPSEKVFGTLDTGYSGTAESVYLNPDRGRIRKLGGAYHLVVAGECTLYRDSALRVTPDS